MKRLGSRVAITGIAAVFIIGILAGCGVLVTLPGVPATQTVQIPDRDWNPPDPVKLEIGGLSLSAPSFNPSTDSATLSAHISKPAQVRSNIVSASSNTPVRSFSAISVNNDFRIQWDGKDDQGTRVEPGDYRFSITATDSSGKQSTVTSDPIALIDKVIVVSLQRQVLTAYDGDNPAFQTVVTTGGPELPTPKGTFHVLDKTQNLYVYSPWPKGSPYWFPDVTYRYALDFYENSQYGLYIHDASWRHEFGPGSNAVDGTPGEDTTGTHGCINVPLAEQEQLFSWATVGTPVIVRD